MDKLREKQIRLHELSKSQLAVNATEYFEEKYYPFNEEEIERTTKNQKNKER